MTSRKSLFEGTPDIQPPALEAGMTCRDLVEALGRTSFEARNVWQGARLLERMIREGDVVWLGVAGAGIAGGMGRMVVSLLEAGFLDVICSTGAQVYHDLHFAFGLPVKAVSPRQDDNALRRCGDTRIYDIGIRERETLEAQDELLREFVRGRWEEDLSRGPLSSRAFNLALGRWVLDRSPHPERSFTAQAARLGVPVFWDSLANHSIAMNLARTDREGYPVELSPQKDVFEAAAIVFAAGSTGFLELGGGGPKNFIQQTGPFISQILGVDFEGAERGLQIGTAVEREGSLSGCTFGEAVTWGKYREADAQKLVQIWGEYSVIFPLLAAYALETCEPRPPRDLVSRMTGIIQTLEEAL